MNGTATRARTSRRPQPGRARGVGSAIQGANALRLDVLDPELAPSPVRQRRPVDPPARAPQPQPVLEPEQRPDTTPFPIHLPKASVVITVVLLAVVGVLGVLVVNTKINENAFKLDDLRDRQAVLDLQEQQLAGQLAELDSPGNLAAAARRLGLVPAGTPAYIRLPDGRVLGAPQPASGTPGVASAAGEPGR
jgi:hypothetical protein